MSKSLKGLLVLALAGAAANSAFAADGQINFTGEIVAASCTAGGPNAQGKNLNVNLGKVAIDTLNTAGAGEAPVKVPLQLELDCSAKDNGVNNVIMTFENYAIDVANPKLLKNTGAAKGVGIGLFSGGTLVDLSTGTHAATAPLTGATPTWKAEFDLSAGYVKALEAPATEIVAGNVVGTLPFTLTYN